jgi:hypothetical protein
LYLEAAGEAVDLRDPELGDAIEDIAPDRPGDVRQLLAERDTDERLAAARLLASMLEDLVSRERTNVMTALTTLTADLGDQLTPDVAVSLAKSIRAFQRPDDLAAEHLPGVLEVALVATDDQLAVEVLLKDALWADDKRTAAVALRSGQLPEQGQKRLEQELAAAAIEDPSLLTTPLKDLPEDRAVELLSSDAVKHAVANAYENDAPELERLVLTLLDAPFASDGPRPVQLVKTLELLRPSHSQTYGLVRERATQIAPILAMAERNQWVLTMWAEADPDDWNRWASLLGAPRKRVDPRVVDHVISHLFSEWPNIPYDAETDVVGYLNKVVPFARFARDESPEFIPVVEGLLGERWKPDDRDIVSVGRLHEAVRVAADTGGQTRQVLEQLLTRDLTAQLEHEATPAVLDAVARIAAELPVDSILDVAERLHQHDPKSAPQDAIPELAARAALALAVKNRGERGWRGPELLVSYNDHIRHVAQRPEAQELLTRWVQLEPTPTAVRSALRRYSGGVSAALVAAIGDWAMSRRKQERTLVASDWLRQDRANAPLIAAVTAHDIAQITLARELASLTTESANADQRYRFAQKTEALRLESQPARQLVADTALELLARGVKADIAVAVALVAGLREPVPRQAALRRAFENAATRHGYKFTAEEAAGLKGIGITPPRESLPKKLWKRFFR